MSPTDSDRAYRRLKERILTVQLRPGSAIREADLMTDLRLGRTPIREALKRLEAEDLVISTPHRGTHVAEIAITDLMQIYEVRVDLEGLSARLAAERAQPVDLERMREWAEALRGKDPTNLEKLFELDRRFHQLLAEATRNRFLRREIDRYYDLSLRIWHLALRYMGPADLDVRAHLELLQCVQQGDAAAAEARMRNHIQHFHTTIKDYL